DVHCRAVALLAQRAPLPDVVIGRLERAPLHLARGRVLLERLDATRDEPGCGRGRGCLQDERDRVRRTVENEATREQPVDEVVRLRGAADLPLRRRPAALAE